MKSPHITGATRLVCLLGNPTQHSLSPYIHNHLFSSLGLPYAYIPLQIPAEHIESAIDTIRHGCFAGANVTIPHKQAVFPLCDSVSELSRLTGTVNTLYFENESLYGDTTDPSGFFRALRWMKYDPKGKDHVILGNGGTARTLGFALVHFKLSRRLTFVGRDEGRVSDVACEITEKTGFPVSSETFSSPSLPDIVRNCSLLVNCTSVGMAPEVDACPLDCSLLHKETTVFDAIYNPLETALLAGARRAGCRTQNGLRMLLYQGLESFRLWTGVTAPESLISIPELERCFHHTSKTETDS
jgi:shikimate dehydrogenase